MLVIWDDFTVWWHQISQNRAWSSFKFSAVAVHSSGRLNGTNTGMKGYVMAAASTVQKVARQIMGAMTEPAVLVAIDAFQKYNKKASNGAEVLEDENVEPFRLLTVYSSRIDQLGGHDTQAFKPDLQDTISQGHEAFNGESNERLIDIIKFGAMISSFSLRE